MEDGMNQKSSTEFESVIDGKTVKLKFKNETLDIERRCDTEYHIAYTQLMQKGIMPKATLDKIMQKQGIWSAEDDKRLQDLQIKLAKLQMDLEAAETHEKGLAVASDMGNLRAECLNLVEVKAAVLSNSCESLADQVRRDAYLAFATVYADTDKPVFKSYEDFLTRAQAGEKVVLDARTTMHTTASRVFADSLIALPEVEYVRRVEGKIMQDAKDVVKTSNAKKIKKKAATKE